MASGRGSARRRRRRRRRGGRGPGRGDGSKRLLVVLGVTLLAFLAITGRLVVLQVVDATSLDQAAARQRLRTIELPADRGRVFDRNGNHLALSVDARAVYAQPRLIRDREGTARRLAPLLPRPVAELRKRLSSPLPWVYLARRVPAARGDAVGRLKLPGIGVLGDTVRGYPSGGLAAQVLGFVDVDGKGLSGVELQYDGLLRGRSGQVVLEQDPKGRPIPSGQRSRTRAPVPGTDIVLTIDQSIQYEAERALAQAVRASHAKGGSVVVLAPSSGEVLAIANLPSYDPNRYTKASREARRNRAVEDVFEPGSTNKTITAAAALEAGVVTPGTQLRVPDTLNLCPGVKTFHDSHRHREEVLSFADVVAQSSNVGTIKVATRLGAGRLAKAELDFGYGRRTGIDLPGESPGLVLPASAWRCTDLGVNAIGQGVAVSVLQAAQVYATVANGGVLVPPSLLKGTVDAGGRFHQTPRHQGRRVVSERTSRTLTGILQGVVSTRLGTGTAAALGDWSVAGKTGTARKPNPHGRGYLPGAYMASFIGFAPAEHPAVAVAVVLDQPTPIYGGVVAAPVFRQVARYALTRLRVPPSVPARAGPRP